MLVSFRETRVEQSGYRQKTADQPFNLLKIADLPRAALAMGQSPDALDPASL